MIFYSARQSAEILAWGHERSGDTVASGQARSGASNGQCRSARPVRRFVGGRSGCGIIMPGTPVLDEPYRQEFYAGHAEDMRQVERLDGAVTVPVGSFEGALVTKDWTPLEPGVEEHKYYVRGGGLVLEDEGRTRVAPHPSAASGPRGRRGKQRPALGDGSYPGDARPCGVSASPSVWGMLGTLRSERPAGPLHGHTATDRARSRRSAP